MKEYGKSVSSHLWHDRVYPALGPEDTRRLFASLAEKDRKISVLGQTVDDLGRRSHEQEQHILKLEAYIKYLESLTKNYEELIVTRVGFIMPEVTTEPEPFSN